MNPLYRDKISVYTHKKIFDNKSYTTKAGYVLTLEDIKCDMQPYSSEKFEKQYGYKVDTTKRLFVDIYDEIKEDSIIKYNGAYYKVQKIILWDKILKHLEIALIETNTEIKVIEDE